MRRWLCSLVMILAAAGPAAAQAVNLTEAPLVDACVRNELTLELKGKISVLQEGKPREFSHEAKATHVFLERFLEADKAARYYTTAKGAITFNGQTNERSLREERCLLVTHRVKDQLVTYSIRGPLSREELELTEHLDTLAVAALAPGKEVKVGDTWPLPKAAAASLCDLEGLRKHDLTCKLEQVKDNRAHVSISGTAEGISVGAEVKLLVTAHYDFDLDASRIVALEWKQSDQRQQGPISPALSADVVIRLKRTPIPEPAELGKLAIEPLTAYPTPPASYTNILFRDAKQRYELQHSRDWHVVSPDGSDQLVLRLVEVGEWLAQATVTPWKKVDLKEAMTLDQFAELMAMSPGWEPKETIEQAELKDAPEGQKIYRVTASGDLEGDSVVQSFYLLVGPQGEQVIVTFTMKPAKIQALRERDVELVKNVMFP